MNDDKLMTTVKEPCDGGFDGDDSWPSVGDGEADVDRCIRASESA